MKRYNPFYYFLFMGVIMGAFASMAQNSYGMTLMGIACLGFSFSFLHELIFAVRTYPTHLPYGRPFLSVELGLLALTALLFFLRSFLIEIPFGKEAVLLSLGLLIIVNLVYAGLFVARTWRNNRLLTMGVVCYYAALVSFLATFVTGVVEPDAAKVLGPFGFIFILAFGAIAVIFKKRVYLGETISVLNFIRNLGNKSGVLILAMLLMFVFFGFSQAGIFPPLYSGAMPSGYLELIRNAESGQEKTTGKKRYEQFEEQYSKFVRRHRK